MDPLRHFSDGGGMCGPTQRRIAQGGNPTGLKVRAGWVEVALARCQTMGRPYLDNTAHTEVRVVEDPPDQVRAVESRGGRVAEGSRAGSCKRYQHEIDYRLWDIGSSKSL